jgi:hypothetical protein
LSRASTGDFVLNGVDQARTDPYQQTDLNLTHEIPVSKAHENMRLKFEANISNLFNNRSATAFNQNALASGLISPTRASRFSGDPQVDWGKIMNGFDPIAAVNATGAFAGVQAKRTLASRYGLGQVFEGARQIRLAFRFQF